MRSFRPIVLALAASAALGLSPSGVAAQQTAATWQDSWFWGVYGGYAAYSTAVERPHAPMIGVDWMLTRTRFALDIFADQSYFNAVSTVPDFSTPAARRVNITDMRRLGFAAMYFTPEVGGFKPYFNAGFAFNFIKAAEPSPPASFVSTAARDSVLNRIDDARAMGKMFAGAGVLRVFGKFAPFAQATVMPTQGSGNWMLNGQGFAYLASIGLRYNTGSSIDRKW
jgi:hypothetical protein